MALIKLCPTCGGQNAPTAARCACGAFLIGVDLSESAPALVSPAASPEELVASVEERSGQEGPVCAFPDCAQPNPPLATVCVYCNRPLLASAGAQPSLTHGPGAGSATDNAQVRPRPVAARRTLISLPASLAARFEIDQPLEAAGAEADLFIVRDRSSGERAVLKLYRQGIEPRTDVLDRVSRAAPDQLVRLIEHGRDEGVPYELLEYCEHGSLRNLLKGRPLPLEAAGTLLGELADAIEHLHACGIVHRDLKPENVLVRGLLPLDLVLTDFGIASLSQATMHYTSAARTLRYSAPEAGSNWVGKPTDYWALGMMLVEALTGRHPFEGLSDAVIAHWLVTRPIDVSAIGDARWQRLCRGLLARDPKARWGAEQIERWLAGVETIALVEEREAPVAGEISPYRVGEHECRTPRELAIALAADWPAGVKDLKRGMLRAWLQNDLRDQNLARFAADAEEALGLSDDERLLRLLLRLDPDLPPVFKGYDVTAPGLAALTRKALEANNEERQAVLELLERGLLSLYPGSPLQELKTTFEQAKAEFEQALERGFQAGAARDLAPEGPQWQLRILLFVLEPPKDLQQNLKASARRVGARAAQRCDWYRALGDVDTAGPATLAAMILLGPPAAQQAMAFEREAARRTLGALSMTIDCGGPLMQAHGAERDRLATTIETSTDEDEVLGLSQRLAELARSMADTLAQSWRAEIFEARPITDEVRLQGLRARISEWARWRAGERWGEFGRQIELTSVLERRSYQLELSSQIETRRVPYSYSAPDVARMPAPARTVLSDVWSCAMPALPQFGADLKLTGPQELRCPRCNAGGRVELQESWGSTAYPFASTFACHDKVGVQCQSRIAPANAHLAMRNVPGFVADFVAAHAKQEPSAQRTIECLAPSIPAGWVETMPQGALKTECSETLAAAARDLKPGERISAQRMRIRWSDLAEVRYRHLGKDYTLWIPGRADALPIALEHPLPSASDGTAPVVATSAAATQSSAAPPRDGGQAISRTSAAVLDLPDAQTSALPRWIKSFGLWVAIFAAIGCLLGWIVNWKP